MLYESSRSARSRASASEKSVANWLLRMLKLLTELVVNQLYRPSDREVEYARRVVESYQEGTARGLGAVNLDGVMVDKPVYERALSLLKRLDAIEGSRAP